MKAVNLELLNIAVTAHILVELFRKDKWCVWGQRGMSYIPNKFF